MAGSHGKFIWYDVMTTDTKSAQAFYESVIGWSAKDSGLEDREYTIFSAGMQMIGGLMPIPEDARARGVRPAWMGYFAVEDVDTYAARVSKAGGKVHRQPTDIPGVGRFAVVADPHGAGFILFKGSNAQAPEPATPGTPGHVAWHELQAGNLEGAFSFYSGLFGWTKSDAIDMGPMGTYQLFSIDGVSAGGIMNKLPEVPAPFWLYYVSVDSIDEAVARVKRAGGTILGDPRQVPGDSWIVQCHDPQRAMFAMVAAKR